jgi:hypothetical protein
MIADCGAIFTSSRALKRLLEDEKKKRPEDIDEMPEGTTVNSEDDDAEDDAEAA